MEELNKFSTERYKAKLREAENTASFGADGIMNINVNDYNAKIRTVDKNSKDGKKIRSDLKELKRSVKAAQRLVKKYYALGIKAPDENRLKNAENIKAHTVAQTLKRKREINAALKEQSVYKRCILPYTQAVTLINQAKNYNDLDDFLRHCDEQAVSQTANAVN